MIANGFGAAQDPRALLTPDELAAASARSAPAVSRPASATDGLGLAAGLIGAAVLGAVTLLNLSHQRVSKPEDHSTPPQPSIALQSAQPPSVFKAAPINQPTLSPPFHPSAINASPPVAATPILVVDSTLPTTGGMPAGGPGGAPPASAKNAVYFTQDEQFSARAADDAPPTSHATHLADPGQTIAQGAIIPAVLETALNSDLPGYARALVSRDVRSFDGSRVLVPRGARLFGQYKSGLQTGQSRALVVWTRLLRPDGVSVQLGSPATDELGQAGLSGKVNSHFMQRFGSAILLTVVSGVATAASGSSDTVVIGTASEGSSAAGVALQNQIKIPPTVRVAQGTPIQVFVARDLDFAQ